MPEGGGAPKGKGGKLPMWAYIAAAGIGLLLAFFLLRKPAQSSDQTLSQPSQASPDNTDLVYNLTSYLAAALAAHGNADGTGSENPSGSSNPGNGEGGGPDADHAHGPIPAGIPCHPHPPGEQGHCTPADSVPDGSPYTCSWCASGSCIKHKGTVDVCA